MENGWLHWPVSAPANNQVPGYGEKPPALPEYIHLLTREMIRLKKGYNSEKSAIVERRIADFARSPEMAQIILLVSPVVPYDFATVGDAGDYMLSGVLKLSEEPPSSDSYGLLLEILAKLLEWISYISEGLLNTDTKLRRLFILLDLGITIITGMVKDGVISKGFDVINNHDFRAWLALHNAAPITISSAMVQAVYGLVFGGNNQYTFEAGTALRGLMRMGFTYKGHIYYRMMAGMGDAIFAPMYQVLMSRGVTFEFFNKVTNLTLSEDKQSVATIEIDIQATLANGVDNYPALVTVNNLPCWPNEPVYCSLEQGPQLQQQEINLESYYSTWQPVGKKVLTTSDFDCVVLGISIGALPAIAPELIAASKAWRQMVNKVIAIPTIAYQLWLNTTIAQMEWPYSQEGLALLGSYQEPYDTWADMSDLIAREDWPAGFTPENIAYFCGPTPASSAEQIMKNVQNADFSDAAFPLKQNIVAMDFAMLYLQTLTQHIWPGISKGPSQFDFDALIDLSNGNATERFAAQFFRANIDPTELYVMSFTGSSACRLKTDKNGYSNLYLTGDWIDNGFNAGCIEATVMAGLQTARAITGGYFEIPGENDYTVAYT